MRDLVSCGELLKGDSWVDPGDPAAAAENELMGAATLIEAASLKLSKLKPREIHASFNKFDLVFIFAIIRRFLQMLQYFIYLGCRIQ